MNDESEKALAEFLDSWPTWTFARSGHWASDRHRENRSAFMAGWQAAMHSGIKFDGVGDFVKAAVAPPVTISVEGGIDDAAGGNTDISGTTAGRE